MKAGLVLLVGVGLGALWLPACVQQLGTDIGDGTSSSSSTSDAGDDGGAEGANCSQDTTTQVTLCTAMSVCPSITVDQSALPGCGFKIHPGSDVIDLECLCGQSLCPIGVPDTCAQVSTLLNGQTALVVCEQASEGKCVEEVQAEAGTTTTTAATTSTCNTQCLVSCGDEPDCQLLCGC